MCLMVAARKYEIQEENNDSASKNPVAIIFETLLDQGI